MITATKLMSVLVVFAFAAATDAEDKQDNANEPPIVWGEVVNGLQLGIAPPVGTNGVMHAMFDGENLCARVFCRNTGKTPIRLLASVHTCLLGKGGNNALLASGIILTPKNGGTPLAVTYQGWNHLALLDKRRENVEPPQQTLNKSLGGKTDIELTKEDADRMTTVLEPGETGRVVQVHFAPNKKPRSWWWLENDSVSLISGTYHVTGFFAVDHQFSDWKGTIKSESLEVEIALPNQDTEHKREPPTKSSTATE